MWHGALKTPKKMAQMLQLYNAPSDRFSQDAQKIVSMFIIPRYTNKEVIFEFGVDIAGAVLYQGN